MKTNMYLEFQEKQVLEADLVAKAKDLWKKNGKKAADLKDIKLYVKPEESMVYVVFNGDEEASFAID